MKVLITGTSSGIGHGLAKHYCSQGAEVYGISRRESDIQSENFHHLSLDLLDYDAVKSEIPKFVKDVEEFDLVILNAGVLGKIQPMAKAQLSELKHTMEMNLWSQKMLLDTLLSSTSIKTVIGISSGAGVNGNLGWSGYSLSKAALNMLIQLYAQEFKQTKFYAFAPGLVDTNMQDHLWEVSEEKYPSVKKLHDARGTQNMPKPEEFASKFEKALPELLKMDSGKFVDIRKM